MDCLLGHSRPPHLLHQGAVITPTMDHTMSMQPASMMGPITQQMNHLSLGTTGSVSTKHVINVVVLRVLMAASCTVSSHLIHHIETQTQNSQKENILKSSIFVKVLQIFAP